MSHRLGEAVDGLAHPDTLKLLATPARERKRITRLQLIDVTMTKTNDAITAHVRLRGVNTIVM
jgi:hypothetical protein